VNLRGLGHSACDFPINVTVPERKVSNLMAYLAAFGSSSDRPCPGRTARAGPFMRGLRIRHGQVSRFEDASHDGGAMSSI
jgi:hypothetical protein